MGLALWLGFIAAALAAVLVGLSMYGVSRAPKPAPVPVEEPEPRRYARLRPTPPEVILAQREARAREAENADQSTV